MSYNIPERNLEPPEDTRKIVCTCGICTDDILEGDEYYEIPELGFCCANCISECHHYEASLD